MRRNRELITGGVRTSRVIHARIFGRRDCSASCLSSGERCYCNEQTSHVCPRPFSRSSDSAITNGTTNLNAGARRLLTDAASSAGTGARQRRIMEEMQRWLDDIVIGQKLCPFAPPVRSAPQLRMVVPDATTSGDGLVELMEQISVETDLLVEGLLNQNQNSMIGDQDGGDQGGDDDHDKNNANDYEYPETTLIILDTDVYPSLGREYRNLVQLSWRVQTECIVDRGHADHLQLVLFHPLAVHDTYMERPPSDDGHEDCADYTIRSPHPTIHLLRQADVMRAVQSGYADLEGLPSRNKARMRRDGVELCRKRLEGCSMKYMTSK